MPITEFVFPSLKPNTAKGVFDPVLSHFRGVEGLLLLKIGKIIRVDGVDAPAENSSVLTIEWEEESQFRSFLESDNFAQFVSKVKPLVAAPAIPQLFDAETRSVEVTSSWMTQILKLKVTDTNEKEAVEQTWNKLTQGENGIKAFQAWGLGSVKGEFLGMIGWDSSEGYKEATNSLRLKEYLTKLKQYGELTIIDVEYPKWT